MKKLEGVLVATVTPFKKNGEIDLSALAGFLEDLAAKGVDGFVPCGTTGESATLTRSERTEVLRLTKTIADKHGLSVVAGCGHNATATALELIKEAKDLGADAALVVTPYYNKPTQAGCIAHYEHLADNGGLPIILYNVPGRTAVSLTPETIKHLLAHPGILGIKEASGSHAQWLAIASDNDLSRKKLFAGDDDAFATVRALGGAGIISASANCAPALFRKIYSLTSEKKWEEAFRLQVRLSPLVRALFAETSPSPLKAALSMMGKCEDTVRLPLVPATEGLRATLTKCLRELELL